SKEALEEDGGLLVAQPITLGWTRRLDVELLQDLDGEREVNITESQTLELGRLAVVVGLGLVGGAEPQERLLVEGLGQELQACGQPRREAAGDREHRDPRQ